MSTGNETRPLVSELDPEKLAYAAAQEIRDMGPDKGTMLSVPFEGMCEVIQAAIVRGYHAGAAAEREACREEALKEKRYAEERLHDQRSRSCSFENIARTEGQIQAAFWVAKHIGERA